MSLFKKNKKNETEIEETTSEVENTAADEALNVTDDQSFVHEFVPPVDTTETSTEEVVENTEIKNEVHEEEKMNEETTQTQQQETAPAPRKRLTTKRVVVTTGIILGAATLITTGVVCWKKFHK